MQRNRLSARCWAERQLADRETDPAAALAPVDILPAKASDYIDSFRVGPGDVFLRICRRSTDKQTDSLAHQQADLARDVESAGGKVATKAFTFTGHGGRSEWLAVVKAAADYARQHGYKLLAENTTRILRHPDHGPENRNVQPTAEHFARLLAATGGLRPMTVLHPDASPAEVDAQFSNRGERNSAKPKGRPKQVSGAPSTQRRIRFRPIVYKLHESGLSIREIARKTGVPFRTVARWLKDRS